MNKKLSAPLALLLIFGFFGLTACEKKGPMEKAGESIDNAVEKASDAVDPKGPMQNAGESVDHAVDKAKDAIDK